MSWEAKQIIVRGVEQADGPGGELVKAREAMEQVVVLARTMGHENDNGAWGQWDYSKRDATGNLYVPFGKGLAMLSLHVGWNMQGNDLPVAKAVFVGGFAYWGKGEGKRVMLVLPGGEWWVHNRGGRYEVELRKYFVYKPEQGGDLRLDEFGSDRLGWYRTMRVLPEEVDYDGTSVPALIDWRRFVTAVGQARMEHKSSLMGLGDVI